MGKTCNVLNSNGAPLKKLRNVVTSCMIGNALEWYDFALHGFFLTMIGKVIFPPDQSPIGFLLKSYAVFFLGFIMRPLGAVVFGYIGDRHGRKKALMWSIYCMAIPTTLIGCLPTYRQVGAWSAIILVILRLFQGLSMGGEFTGSMIFVVEHAPEGKKGLWGSWSSLSVLIGLLFGSIFGTIISTILSAEDLESWGWRIPFLLSFAGSWVGASLRKSTDEPVLSHTETGAMSGDATQDKPKGSAMLLRQLFSNYWRDMLRVVVIDIVVAVGFFMISIYIMGYLQSFSGQTYQFSVISNTVSLLIFAATIPFSGWLSDRWGTICLMQRATVILGCLSIPCFWGLMVGKPWQIMLAQALLAGAMGGVFAPIPALMVSIFPSHVRYSGVSIAHNISMAIFGGSTPQVATYLIDITGNKMMPGFFLALAAMVSWLGLENLKKSRGAKSSQNV